MTANKKPKISTQSFFPSTLVIDGVSVDVRVTRMTNTQYDTFAREFAQWSDPRGPEPSAEDAAAREAQSNAWTREALNAYLAIVPGEMEHEEQPVVKGGQLLDIYAGRDDVVPQALALVLLENRVSEAQKKTYKLALVSRLGSTSEPQQTDTGSAPASTVDVAEPRGSVAPEAAMEPLSAELCGTTGQSC
jgi:hypothetical protein